MPFPIEQFDVEDYLKSRSVRYWTTGKNVSPGWINIQCVFCSDTSNHLGISPARFYSCWKCGERGHIAKIIQEIEGGCSIAEANTIIDQYILPSLPSKPAHTPAQACSLPERLVSWPPAFLDYLAFRRFDVNTLERLYGVYPAHFTTTYKYRIVIPVKQMGEIVSFTSLDITGKQEDRYRSCSIEKSIIPLRSCLYNVDAMQDDCLIVEGPTDVWRMGPGTVATFGIKFTTEQVQLLLERKPKRVRVMFDSEPFAISQANALAEILSKFVPDVRVVSLRDGDPADFSDTSAQAVKEYLFSSKKGEDNAITSGTSNNILR